MNERFKELAEQANIEFTYDPTETPMRAFAECWEDELEKFAGLIVKDVINQCHQEWYNLNNAPQIDNETPRDIGIRIGQKSGVLKCVSQLTKHFGVK